MTAAFESVGRIIVGRVAADQAPTPASIHGEASAAGRRLLTEAIAAAGEPGAVVTSHCDTCGGDDHGRPVVASGRTVVSVAYAAGLVMVAAAPAEAASAIGIDVETDRAGALDDLAALFAPHPAPDVRRWTQLEAALKADGRGIRVSPERVVIAQRAGRAFAEVPGREGLIELFDAPAPRGYRASLAVIPPAPG